jgi:hypothetical protein
MMHHSLCKVAGEATLQAGLFGDGRLLYRAFTWQCGTAHFGKCAVHCCVIIHPCAAATFAAGDNIVWTSYTVYESVEAAFKHMR